MKHALIGCVKKKRKTESVAIGLYISPLFVKSVRFAHFMNYEIFILSAKYGLLDPLDRIKPYNLTLKDLSKNELEAWYNNVSEKLLNIYTDGFVVLAGTIYWKELVERMDRSMFEFPLHGKPIGERLQWLTKTMQ